MTCGKRSPQHDRNVNAVVNISLFYEIPYCPQAGGRCSVTGRLWPFPDRDGETSPVTRFGGRSENGDASPNGRGISDISDTMYVLKANVP